MQQTKRSRMLDLIAGAIREVAPGNGYEMDLRQCVYIGRSIFGDDTPLPTVAILESTKLADIEWPGGDERTVRKVDWPILCQGWAPYDKSDPTGILYYMAACVIKELTKFVLLDKHGRPVRPDLYRLEGLAASFTIGSPIVRPVTQAESAFFYLPLMIEIQEDLTSPFL